MNDMATGVLSGAPDHPPVSRLEREGHSHSSSRHAVQFYESDQFLSEAVGSFVAEGLLEGDGIVVIATTAHWQQFSENLEARGIDVLSAERVGQLQFREAERLLEQFMHEGLPDEERLTHLLEPILEQASAGNTRKIRIYGEMVQLLLRRKNAVATLRLEALWNEKRLMRPFALLCGYQMDSFERHSDSVAFEEICDVHPTVRPAMEVPGPEAADDRSRMIAMLQQQALALQSEVTDRKRAEERLAILAEASDVLASSLDYDTTLHNVVQLALPRLADFGFFDLVEAPDRVRRISLAHQDARRQAMLEQTQWAPSNRVDINLCALSSGQAGFHPHIDDAWMISASAAPPHLELMRALAFCSMITVPMIYEGHVLGALTLFYADSQRHHTRADLALAEELARRAAGAVQNARLHRDLQAAIAQREEADHRKDEFLAMLGHELRNPLAPILTALELMSMRGSLEVEREREVIERQTRHLVRMVDDLLDISRITRGLIELRKESIELAPVVARAIELASPLFEKRNHHLEIQVPQGLRLEADPDRLAQVFANLLTNAAKYTEPGGRITIAAFHQDARLTVEVTDNGPGIAVDALGPLFEPFVQGARALDRTQGGLGLGLTLVRSLVELHGGRVSAFSEGLGKGSRFTVTLPAPAPFEPTRFGEAAVAEELDSSSPESELRVLVVDDNRDAAELLGEALRQCGYEVQIAHDGPQALELVRRFSPHVALLDIGLPVMDGYELGRRLRQEPGLEALQLFAVTGYGQESDRARTREAGFHRHFVKPIKLEVVEKALADVAASVLPGRAS